MTVTNTQVSCRAMQSSDAERVSRLILDSFDEFIAPEYSEGGRSEFRRYVDPAALERRTHAHHFILVAEVGDDLAGMMEIRQNDHVALLFVNKRFHHHGVAHALVDQAIATARSTRPDLDHLTGNSSRYGVAAYERLGFTQTGPERTINGIAFIPMAKRL